MKNFYNQLYDYYVAEKTVDILTGDNKPYEIRFLENKNITLLNNEPYTRNDTRHKIYWKFINWNPFLEITWFIGRKNLKQETDNEECLSKIFNKITMRVIEDHNIPFTIKETLINRYFGLYIAKVSVICIPIKKIDDINTQCFDNLYNDLLVYK